MKTPLQLVAAFVLFQATVEASIIYQTDFSSNSNPGWSRTTISDNVFANTWSITPSLESESGNQHARFDFNIPTQPSNPNATWYGGYYAFAGPLTTLPAKWQLSFDVFLNSVEPIKVSFDFVSGQGPFTSMTSIIYWVQPAAVGWQPVVINQSTAYYATGQGSATGVNGTFLNVDLSSKDPQGNPLTISQIGTYDFLLDNVVLQSVPEPSALSLCALTSILFIGVCQYRTIRYRQRGVPVWLKKDQSTSRLVRSP